MVKREGGMVRIALIDDNKKDLALMQKYLQTAKESGTYDAFSFDCFADSMEFIETYDGKYDIVFLDIEMPHLDGMELSRRLRRMGSECCIIFITNMPQYAVQGYEVEALAYLIKPVRFFHFSQVLKKAMDRVKKQHTEDRSIVLKTPQEVKVVASSSIRYIEVESHNLVFHMAEGDLLRTRASLKTLEEQLEGMNFCRCNSCYLVNLRYVDSVVGNTVRVGDEELLMSRHKKKEFVEQYMKYTR